MTEDEKTQVLGLGNAFCLAMVFTRVTSIDKKNRRIKEMLDCFKMKKIGIFAGGVLFGTAGVKNSGK